MLKELKQKIVEAVYPDLRGEDFILRLEDVLSVLNKNTYAKDFWAVDTSGHCFAQSMTDGSPESLFDWQLGKTLDQQSKETIEFLYKLLK